VRAEPAPEAGWCTPGALRATRQFKLQTAPCSHFGSEGAEAGAGAMLVAYRLPGLSAFGAYYAGVILLPIPTP
jgi:hypothetical protein